VGHLQMRNVGHLLQMLRVDICYTCPLFANGSHINGPSK
jgi:hypothetical protein